MRALYIWIVVCAVTCLYATSTTAAPVPCSTSDKQIAKTAQVDARGTLQSATKFIKGGDQKTRTLITRWFGNADATTVANISGVFNRSDQWLSTVNFYCLYQNDGGHVADLATPAGVIRVDYSGNLFAYVDANELGKINLGLAFFKAQASTGYDSRLGTLVHEMTHFWLTGNTNSTSNEEYDKPFCLELAKRDPAKAQKNAQNYEYFVEEWLAH
jgi:peptidyl-Lys metalloendopeptidase